MPISDWIEKLGRTIFESPFEAIDTSKTVPELAEIRLAILQEVKAKSHRVSGRPVFPFNRVHIRLRGVPETQADIFRGPFFSRFCEQEIRSGLKTANYRFPEDLGVEVETTPVLPKNGEEWLSVESASRDSAPAGQAKRVARLVIVKGTANEGEVLLSKTRTNIGRTIDVYRSDGPSRRNDLAFAESGEINRTVSREHAHIIHSKKTGEYRLFNDRWYKPTSKADAQCGVWIIRDGLSQPVHRDSRGTRLLPGDEIHIGRAVLRFVLR
jgi:hypothetical protein